jgi:divalent metal cation (Fe/Co/Zn/Cd) transporter
VEMALSELAAKGRNIRDIHDVRVRETDEGEIVNFHCQVDPQSSVQSVHEDVDALERALRWRFTTIKRVIGHAEPAPMLPPENSAWEGAGKQAGWEGGNEDGPPNGRNEFLGSKSGE